VSDTLEPCEFPPDELLASKLIDAWCADKGKQIPWAKAVQIIAIVTKQSDAERDRLLHLDDEDGSCGMCGRKDTNVGPFRIINQSNGKLYVGHENGEGGTFTEAQLLPYIEEFWSEEF
jgi:hypothetical protein